MSARLEQLASEKAPRDVIAEAARDEGMRTMWEDGIDKVAARPHHRRRARARLLGLTEPFFRS